MTSISRPMCFARDRNGCVYGVNGEERGVRYDVLDKSPSVQDLGMSAPTIAPTITYTTKSPKYYVTGVDVIYGGFNYQTIPTITLGNAAAKVELTDGRISSVQMQSYGAGFTAAPSITCSAPSSTSPYGSGATFGVSGSGGVTNVLLTNTGTGYTSPPTVTITEGGKAATLVASIDVGLAIVSKVTVTDGGEGYTSAPTVTVTSAKGDSGYGAAITTTIDPPTGKVVSATVVSGGANYAAAPTLTAVGGRGSGAFVRADVDPDTGAVVSAYVLNEGAGYTIAPTLTFSAPASGITAVATAVLTQSVTDVQIKSAGSGYFGAPALTFTSLTGSGAFAQCETNYDTGAITAVNLIHGGEYQSLPTAKITVPDNLLPAKPKLSAVMKAAILGKYWCAYRFIDDTPAERGGPIPSSLSPLTEVEITGAADGITWQCPATGADFPRATKIELWRSTADQALVLYRVATLSGTATPVGGYLDTFGDNELLDPARTISGVKVFEAMPIVLPDGSVNAYRFTPPPQNKAVVVMFQDRAWYAVDRPGRTFAGVSDSSAAGPNTLYFSEIGEPESVPETNELILQTNVRGTDSITALMPAGGGMVIFQNRHAYRMTYASQPILDAGVQLICQRGCLNQRCWDTYDGVAYVADAMGMYTLDGTQATPISDVVDTYWANGTINFSSSKWFFVRVDPVTRIARFFFNESGTYADRALCFHPVTKAWWLEVYAQRFSSSECLILGGRQRAVVSGESGGILKMDDGSQDIQPGGGTQNIACSLRTGNMALSTEGGSRSVRVLYKTDNPGENTPSYLTLGLHYNGSSTARPAAVATSRGTGFTTDGGANATLNMANNRSLLGDATGYAVASYAGRVEDKSAGGDRHLAIALSTTRTTTNAAIVYSAAVEGVS